MQSATNLNANSHDADTYCIRVRGQFSAPVGEWLGEATLEPDGPDTLLFVSLPDQAALFGLLRKVRDLGLPLISVRRLGEEGCDERLSQ